MERTRSYASHPVTAPEESHPAQEVSSPLWLSFPLPLARVTFPLPPRHTIVSVTSSFSALLDMLRNLDKSGRLLNKAVFCGRSDGSTIFVRRS